MVGRCMCLPEVEVLRSSACMRLNSGWKVYVIT